jgi:ribosomal protein S18 acetylase RimI-like enzyme
MMIEVVELSSHHRALVAESLIEHFGSSRVVSLGRLHDASTLPGLLATTDGEPAGFLLYDARDDEYEAAALVAFIPRRGIGRVLVDTLVARATAAGASRIVVATTNDNVGAQAFYEAEGFTLVAVRRGAIRLARELKPEIPLLGEAGVPIKDELVYELR